MHKEHRQGIGLHALKQPADGMTAQGAPQPTHPMHSRRPPPCSELHWSWQLGPCKGPYSPISLPGGRGGGGYAPKLVALNSSRSSSGEGRSGVVG
jgi:hypothetical protein